MCTECSTNVVEPQILSVFMEVTGRQMFNPFYTDDEYPVSHDTSSHSILWSSHEQMIA